MNASSIGTSDILSIIAIIISVLGFVLGQQIDNFFNGPKCRIAVFSVPKGLQIRLENVGNRIMRVKKVTYTVSPDKKDKSSYTENLSSLFYSIPCETRAEARLTNQALFPNSKHNLLTITFDTQERLIEAWEKVASITVKVEYYGPIKRFSPTTTTLKDEYDVFIDALKDENGNYRKLKAFSDYKQ